MIEQLTYLLQFYWPYMAGVFVIGVVAGWISLARKSEAAPK